MFPLECHKFHPDFPSFLAKNFVRDVQDYENAKFFLLFHVQIMSRKWEKFYRSNFVWSKVFSPINSLILNDIRRANGQTSNKSNLSAFRTFTEIFLTFVAHIPISCFLGFMILIMIDYERWWHISLLMMSFFYVKYSLAKRMEIWIQKLKEREVGVSKYIHYILY